MADFFLLSALFFAVEFLKFGFDHITSHRQKKWPIGVSPMGHGFLSACFGFGFQPLLLGGDFRLHLCYHICQQFFTLLLAVGVDVASILFAVRPDGGIPSLPQFLIDLGDTARACLASLTFASLEGAGGGFRGAAPVSISESTFPIPWSIFTAAVRRISSVIWA